MLFVISDVGMNGNLTDTQDSRSSDECDDLDDDSVDSEKALNLVSIE